jgi:uncharacterized protein YjdB
MAITSLAIGIVNCGDSSLMEPLVTGTEVVSVSVTPPSATIRLADRLQLDAQVRADAGVVDRSVVWSSSDASVASVSQAGLVTPTGGAGVVTITAASKADTTVTGKSTITVTAATP